MASSEGEQTRVKVEIVKEEPEDTENWAEQRIHTPLFVERCIKQPPLVEIKCEPLDLESNTNNLNDGNERFLNFTYSGIWRQESSERIDEEDPLCDVKDESFEETETCVQYTSEPSKSTSRIGVAQPYKEGQNAQNEIKNVIQNTKQSAVIQMLGSFFSTKEQDMVVHMYRYIEENLPKDQYPYKMLLNAKTASILGISTNTVHKILKLASNGTSTLIPKPLLSDKIDELTNNAIRKKMHILYMKGEIPTMNKLFHAISVDENLPNVKMSTFKTLLSHLKIKTIKKGINYPLIDTEDVILSRLNYLRKIKEYRRQKRCIYYLDELWLYAVNTAKKKNATTKTSCMVISHIGNEHGFVDGGLGIFFPNTGPYHRKIIKAYQFEDWFEQILPKLEKNSLVVMDDAPYHSRMHGKTPTMGWEKKDIQDWLRNKGVDYDEDHLKFELLNRIKEAKVEYDLYAVDDMAKRRNIEVLRLPPYHYELNPIKVIWADIKAIVSKYKMLNTNKLGKIVNHVIENKLSIEKWHASVQEVVDLEDNFYCKIDAIMDDAIDSYLDHRGACDSESETDVV